MPPESTEPELGEPVNSRNVRCWCGHDFIDFRMHLDLASLPDGISAGAGGYTFFEVPEIVVDAIRLLQEDHARLQERVWELEEYEEAPDA